jgi:hypothetical protein
MDEGEGDMPGGRSRGFNKTARGVHPAGRSKTDSKMTDRPPAVFEINSGYFSSIIFLVMRCLSYCMLQK